MRRFLISFEKSAAATALLLCSMTNVAFAGGTYSQIYPFTGGATGANPPAGLTGDADGNLYGAAQTGGIFCSTSPSSGCGTVFKLNSAGEVSTVFSFQGGASGANPDTDLTLVRGALYGGAFIPRPNGTPNLLLGVLFSVRPDGSGYAVLHTFDGAHGRNLTGRLQHSASGGFFGVSGAGGHGYDSRYPTTGNGVLFYLSPAQTYAVAHYFDGGADGALPNALLQDSVGDLFGSTIEGGEGCESNGCGTIFEYTPSTRIYRILYTFHDGADGAGPTLGSIGANGTLYGVTGRGSSTPHGTLFSLSTLNGIYSFTTLTRIISHTIGDVPTNAPVLTAHGALVGATGFQIYGFENGQFVTLLDIGGTGLDLTGRFTVPAGKSTLYGTSYFGGTGRCSITANGCGNLFSYSLQ